ncbi:MAG: bifunctional YncE family protein/alkaline phosphatase family protein [Solirubrobacteraceae bacterium]
MSRSRRVALAAVTFALIAGGAIAVAQLSSSSKKTGRVSPKTGLQVSGRKLNPAGKLTPLGSLPAGAALTPNGRFLWTVSAGRGRNDVRIVTVPRRGRGRVRQTLPLPGSSGGIAIAPDGRTAYVAGTGESGDKKVQSPEGTPGKAGDVIHVFAVNPRSGRATRDGVIEVPPPSGSPVVQSFPPETTKTLSWPRDIAVSPDGETLLAALNLANRAAIVDTESRAVRYVKVGSYPYGAAITRDGKTGLVSNEADGTVSVIDLEAGTKMRDVQVGPHLSHPEGIAIDPKRDLAYVAVTHQDLIAVLDLKSFTVTRTLSVERPVGIGTAPVALSVDPQGCRLVSANSGEDAVAVFALSASRKCFPRKSAPRAQARAQRVLSHEGRQAVDLAENTVEEEAEIYGEEAEERAEAAKRRRPARPLPKRFELLGRVPIGSYPVFAAATPRSRQLVWVAAKGLGTGPNDASTSPAPIVNDPGSATSGRPEAQRFRYLPTIVKGIAGVLPFPGARALRRLTPRASRQIRPSNKQKAPPGSPIAGPGPSDKIKHVFYIVRENRTYDQILGDDPRGDGDPKLTLFGEDITPNAHALAKRFPLLDHVYANSEASIDGHFWTSAAAVSDYVVKNWHQNYAGRGRPFDFGVYAVTWPSQRFLFDQAEKQGISYFNFGEAVAGTVPLPDRDRNAQETKEVAKKFAKSDLGQNGCFPNDASSGGVDVVLSAGPGPDVEVYDSSLPEGASPLALSRFNCLRTRFNTMVAQDAVPQFTYITLPNDHTAGTTPGQRTPNAMIAENDWALGQTVELISKSPVWKDSLILVIEDDSQDGADHVDAHRIPAFAISPYAKRGAVIHTRYDFLSFIRTLEIAVGMEPLNLFDAVAVPMYDVFTSEPENGEPYTAIRPDVNLTERNTAQSPNARLSARLPLNFTDRTPQRYLDKILWQYVHGPGSEPPPPGPNASGLDEARWKRGGAVTPEQALEALLEEQEEE